MAHLLCETVWANEIKSGEFYSSSIGYLNPWAITRSTNLKLREAVLGNLRQ